MSIVDQFVSFARLGAEWVMWTLVVLSIISLGIVIERLLYYRRNRVDVERLRRDVRELARQGDVATAELRYGSSGAMEVAVAIAGLKHLERGPHAAAEAMIGTKSLVQKDYERNLGFLGTLGANAPFIGLFGTVLGIMSAFQDLAEDTQGGAKLVMTGVSEALAATAVGLFVAIPAVIFFNYFQRRVRVSFAQTDAVAHELLAEMRGGRDEERA